LRIEDYALIGDTSTAALVGKNGSIDWLCLPRFDSPACFAALLGSEENGHWRIAPEGKPRRIVRSYRSGTLLLETVFVTGDGSVALTDCMQLGGEHPRVLRVVEGRRGSVVMRMEYVVRFDYGHVVPWVRRTEDGLLAVAGPDALLLAADVELRAEGMRTIADFTVKAGERVAFALTYFASQEDPPDSLRFDDATAATEAAWRKWAGRCAYTGPYRREVLRSLMTLRALTYESSGGIVAAATSSLPEKLGGVRNWDYRYCWLRDATFTLYALLAAGYTDAARSWRAWLLRAVAGSPGDLQVVYDVCGARRLPEWEVPWLAGYEGAAPVRMGNDAHGQVQLDVYGEVIDLLYVSHRFGIEGTDDEWVLSKAIVAAVEEGWRRPDRGIWEMRGTPQHYTHSKVMAWVALDRAVRSVEEFGFDGPAERWRAARDEIFADVCTRAYDGTRETFTQFYGSRELDASTLMIPLVGFLPIDDPRVRGTIAAIEQHLLHDGLVYRYTQDADTTTDALPPGEAAFLACSFWLVDCYVLAGRHLEAKTMFERLLKLTNDVGLLAEEYDPVAERQLGNFPQAFSHVGLVNSAFNLSHHTRPAEHRGSTPGE